MNQKIKSGKLGSGSFFGIRGGSFFGKHIQAAVFLTSANMGRRQFFHFDEAAEQTFTITLTDDKNSLNIKKEPASTKSFLFLII